MRRRPFFGVEEAFHDPVFERVEGDYCKSPAIREQPLGGKQTFNELAELIVHGNAQGLEAAGRRVRIAGLAAD